MSLDFYLMAVRESEVFNRNITHNLGGMAAEAGIYKHLWRPEEIGVTHAHQLIVPLCIALSAMKADPERFKKHNAPNGWGLYEHFVEFVQDVLAACEKDPDAKIEANR